MRRIITKRSSKRLGVAVVALTAIVQLVPYGRTHTNPRSVAEPPWDSPQTRVLAQRACFDCHSNETKWPWYSDVAPFSWVMKRHVEVGRSVMNFSEWTRPYDLASQAGAEARAPNAPEVRATTSTPPCVTRARKRLNRRCCVLLCVQVLALASGRWDGRSAPAGRAVVRPRGLLVRSSPAVRPDRRRQLVSLNAAPAGARGAPAPGAPAR